MTVIEVKPRKWGWCVFESPGVEPVFLQKDQAIGYAETRACFRVGEIRILGFNWQRRADDLIQRSASKTMGLDRSGSDCD